MGVSASLKTWESCDGPTAGLLLRVGVLDLALLVGQAVLRLLGLAIFLKLNSVCVPKTYRLVSVAENDTS